MGFRYDVCVIGGCGHVGLPLALTFADAGLNVCVHDINDEAVATVNAGRMPFLENGAEPVLRRVLGRTLVVADDPALISQSQLRRGRHRHAGRRAPEPDVPDDAAVLRGAAAPGSSMASA